MDNLTWLHLFLLILATFRLTRLMVYDEITRFLRDPFLETHLELEENGNWVRKVEIKGTGFRAWMGKLISCHWCMGIWAALFILLMDSFIPLGEYVILLLAIAGGGSLLQAWLDF